MARRTNVGGARNTHDVVVEMLGVSPCAIIDKLRQTRKGVETNSARNANRHDLCVVRRPWLHALPVFFGGIGLFAEAKRAIAYDKQRPVLPQVVLRGRKWECLEKPGSTIDVCREVFGEVPEKCAFCERPLIYQ